MTLTTYIRSAVRAFWEGEEEDDADTSDPLLSMAQEYPEEVAWFIKVVMSCGSLSSLFLSIQCGTFLYAHWVPCGYCSRPLRHWLLVLCVLKAVQAPVRVAFFLQFWRVQRHNGNVEQCVAQITQSAAWKASKSLSMFSYGWVVLGSVWLANTGSCAPRLYRLAVEVVLATIFRLCVTVVFYHCFLKRDRGAAATEAPPKGAEQSIIDLIPIVKYAGETSGCDDCGINCAVCLASVATGDMLRELPCGHCFHVSCIDPWLKLNKVCPLCLRDIQAPPLPPSRHMLKRRAGRGVRRLETNSMQGSSE